MQSRVYETVERPSVCPSVRPIFRPPHAAAAGLLLWARRQEMSIDAARPALSSKCEQCHVAS